MECQQVEGDAQKLPVSTCFPGVAHTLGLPSRRYIDSGEGSEQRGGAGLAMRFWSSSDV
jgi:hypothetical protein